MFNKKIWSIISFCLLILGMAYFSYIPVDLFNIDYSSFSQNEKIIYTFIMDLLFILVIFLIYRKSIIHDGKEYFSNFKVNFKNGFKYYLIGLIIMVVSNILINLFFKSASANNETTIRNLIDSFPFYMIFSTVIYAPFIEEIIFRKNIYDCVNSFEKSKVAKYAYVFISGFIFSILHVVGSASSNLDYLYIIPYLSLGITFALLYLKSNNIFSTISMHAFHNLVAVILYFIRGVIL